MPFGVELPDNIGATSESAPETQSSAPETGKSLEGASAPETTRELLDLDKQERFRFNGKEMTLKELQNSYLMHADYTRKTQEISEARKYADNFAADLRTVLREPARFSELARIYPAEYVREAQQLLEEMRSGTQPSPQTASPNSTQTAQPLPNEVRELMAFKQTWEQERREQAIQSTQRELDSLFQQNSKKYNFADADTINSRAIAVVENGHKLTPQIIEKLFKQHHDEVKARFEAHYKAKVEEQKRAGSRARDAGPGGSPMGGAPKKETIREARDRWLADIESR